MNKHFFLIILIITTIFVTTNCTNKDSKNKINAKESSENLSKTLDFSYFPAESTVLAIIDFQSIFSVKAFQPMLQKAFNEIKKKSGLDVSKLKSLSAFINVKDFKNNPLSDAAIILDGIDITKAKNFPKAIKTEKFEGLNINVYDDKTGFVVVGGKTVGGTLTSVRNAISLNRGKAKNLASTPKNNDFKSIISKLNGSQVSLSFVSNENTDAEIKKYSNNPQFYLIKPFIDDFKAISFGIKADEKKIVFTIIAKSSKEGVKFLESLIKTQLKQFQGTALDSQLKPLEMVITRDGTQIIKNMIETIKIEAKEEYLSIDFVLTVKDALKIPEILMLLGITPPQK
jgi:hypothetical protein